MKKRSAKKNKRKLKISSQVRPPAQPHTHWATRSSNRTFVFRYNFETLITINPTNDQLISFITQSLTCTLCKLITSTYGNTKNNTISRHQSRTKSSNNLKTVMYGNLTGKLKSLVNDCSLVILLIVS